MKKLDNHILRLHVFALYQEHGIDDDEYYGRKFFGEFNYVVWNSRTKNISAKQLFEDITFSFEEVVERIELHHTKEGENVTKSTVIKLPHHQSMIQTQYYYMFGKCYTLSLNNEIKKLGIRSISVWM